jgi:hypothetical protein
MQDTPDGPAQDGSGDADEVDDALRAYLLYVMLPLWFVPGILDWNFHRRTKIEETSGTHESLTHALMMSIIGAPILAALLFEINALLLAGMIAGYFAHESVAYWDVKYATGRRHVGALEQQTHSFLEVLPFMGASLCSVLKWKQFLSIFGVGPETAEWKLEWKRRPQPAAYTAAILGGVLLFVVTPYVEEFVRCFRVDHTLLPHEDPDAAEQSTS